MEDWRKQASLFSTGLRTEGTVVFVRVIVAVNHHQKGRRFIDLLWHAPFGKHLPPGAGGLSFLPECAGGKNRHAGIPAGGTGHSAR